MKTISEYSEIIEKAISSLNLPQGNLAGLYSPIIYGMSAGGKRLRPILTLMACDAFGCDVTKAIKAAVGLEMYHNFTLLHDDVMDNSDLRRGRPTVHKKWNANTAILSGDTMLTLATQLIMSVNDEKLRSVLEAFNDMAIDVFEGQQLDMDFETRDNVCLTEYIEMITGKTSALLGCAAKIGGLIAGCSDIDAQALYDFGVSLGLAFQIQDDFLDVYGDEKNFGKPIGGDILNDKKTFLMLTAISSPSPDKDILKKALALSASEAKIACVREAYNQLGVVDSCRDAIMSYSKTAADKIDSTSMSEDGKAAFKGLIESLVGRSK